MLGEGTRLVAYLSVKYRGQEVEKKEEYPNWCILKFKGITSGGIYMNKQWTVRRYEEVAANLGSNWRRGWEALLLWGVRG